MASTDPIEVSVDLIEDLRSKLSTAQSEQVRAEWDLNLIEHVFIATMSSEVQAHFSRFKKTYLDHTAQIPRSDP